jgi:hypothetical protein
MACFGANAYGFVWDSWIQWYLFELTFGLYDFFEFCQRLGLVLVYLFSQEVYVLVA